MASYSAKYRALPHPHIFGNAFYLAITCPGITEPCSTQPVVEYFVSLLLLYVVQLLYLLKLFRFFFSFQQSRFCSVESYEVTYRKQ